MVGSTPSLKDGSFSGFGEFCSSIDAILLNRVAHNALLSIEVLALSGVQHRPVRATFSWKTIRLHGFIHKKFAPLNVEHLEKPGSDIHHPANLQAQTLWDNSFYSQYSSVSSFEDKWSVLNQFCVDTLLVNGASWGNGPRVRGKLPEFTAKQFCPGQARNNSALTLKGSWLQNTLARLVELATRLQRPVSSVADQHILSRTALRTWRTLHALKSPFVWTDPQFLTLVDIHQNHNWVEFQLQSWDFRKRQDRIRSWKAKIQASATHNKKYIYHHLKNKVADEPSNLVLDANQNIVCQPNEALI